MLTPFVRDAGLVTAGTLTTGFSISGPLDDPRVGGTMALSGGEARLDRPRIVVTNLASAGVLKPRRIQFRELTGSINGGRLAGSVDVEYPATLRWPCASPPVRRDGAGAPRRAAQRGRRRPGFDASRFCPQGAVRQADGNHHGRARLVSRATRGGDGASCRGCARSAWPVRRRGHLVAVARGAGARRALVTDSDIVVDDNHARLQLGGDLQLVGTAAAPR